MCESIKAQVIEAEQVWGEEGAIHGVVHAGLGHGPEEVAGVDEAGGVSGDNGGLPGILSHGNSCLLPPVPAARHAKLEGESHRNVYRLIVNLMEKVLDFVQDGGVYVTGGAAPDRGGNGYIGRLHWWRRGRGLR